MTTARTIIEEATTTAINYVEASFLVEWISEETSPFVRSATGYGNKLPTRHKVKCSDNRTRRMYAICHSNSASYYIIVGGETLFIKDWDIPV